jgi:hypothetical protein
LKTALQLAFTAIVLAALAGCASNPIVGHGVVQAGRYHGDVGISGNGTTLTIQSGSMVSKLSIVGDGSKVMVEDGAELSRIEFWGNGNTVSIPDNLEVSIAAMGTNQVIRRPRAAAPGIQPAAATSPPAGTGGP